MFRTVAVIFLSVLMLTGCVNFLEDEKVDIRRHLFTPYERPPVDQITVADYDELLIVVIRAIMAYETGIHLLYYHRDIVEINEDLRFLRNEILYEHPVGAYIVANINANATRIVTHYEIDIEIEYKRTKEQLDSIIVVSTEQSVRTNLLRFMSEYSEVIVFRSRLQLNEEVITELVRDTYYQNPHLIVMLPMVTVETFPEEGLDRIYEIQFGNTENPRMLQQYGSVLTMSIQLNAERAIGSTDSETLITLVNNLIESTSYDEAAARTIHAHGVQNFAATAWGALIRGNAVGEGFAMAFKALADELGFDCRVILGHLDGMVHAWNIVALNGDFYHIDVSMCVVNGIESAFLKSDTDFEEMMYAWDRENTVRCEGPLTLEDLLGNGVTGGNNEEDDEPDEEEEEI